MCFNCVLDTWPEQCPHVCTLYALVTVVLNLRFNKSTESAYMKCIYFTLQVHQHSAMSISTIPIFYHAQLFSMCYISTTCNFYVLRRWNPDKQFSNVNIIRLKLTDNFVLLPLLMLLYLCSYIISFPYLSLSLSLSTPPSLLYLLHHRHFSQQKPLQRNENKI